MQDRHVLPIEAVNDDVLADSKTAQAGAKIGVAPASDARVVGQKIETLSDGINKPVGYLGAAAFFAT